MLTGTYLSPPEVADRLGINAGKVLAWIRSGELRATNVAARAGVSRRLAKKVRPSSRRKL